MTKPITAGYLPRDVTKLTGVPYSKLNLWAKQGFIRPTIRDAQGTGSERIYSEADVKRLRMAFILRRAGLSLALVKQALEKFECYPRSRQIDLLLSKEPYIYVRISRPL